MGALARGGAPAVVHTLTTGMIAFVCVQSRNRERHFNHCFCVLVRHWHGPAPPAGPRGRQPQAETAHSLPVSVTVKLLPHLSRKRIINPNIIQVVPPGTGTCTSH